MTNRRYYSEREGKLDDALDLATLCRFFFGVYRDFEDKDYFQEHFGFQCVDIGNVPGKVGSDVERYMYRKLRKDHLWPIQTENYSEDDLFDVIEFLSDHISRPAGGSLHSFSNCGQHYWPDHSEFDADAGREEFRSEVNELLRNYSGGYELSPTGEIMILPEKGMEHLLANQLPQLDPTNVEDKIAQAVVKFRRYRSSPQEKRAAVRELADVLEFLRPRLKDILTQKDEADLFNIANNFGVRHHNAQQKTGYDQDIWLPWMFYFYLATIHAALRLIKRRGT